jgi:hypothetical protein
MNMSWLYNKNFQIVLGLFFVVLYPLMGFWILTSDRFDVFQPDWLRKTFGVACIILGILRLYRLIRIWREE